MGQEFILTPGGDDAVLINRGEPVGFDSLRGSSGNDTMGFDFGVEGYLFGDQGNDFISGTVEGKAGIIFGGQGADTILGLGGPISVNGNRGNDSIVGGTASDSLRGGQDDDLVIGGFGNDTIYGDDGNDFLVGDDPALGLGFGSQDVIFGNQGADTIFGSDGRDTIYGGQDDDLIDSFTESIDYTGGSDVIFGDLGNDTIGREDSGNANNPDNDTLLGGEGDDSVVGGYGDDDLFGDEGDDTVRGGLAGRDFIDGGEGDDSLLGGDEVVPPNLDFPFGDTLLGGAGEDTIMGGDGEDLIEGGDDIDLLFGDNDRDTILGGDGDDAIDGGDGNDSLIGGLGEDALEGGAGSDTLIGNEVGATSADAGDLFLYGLVDVTQVDPVLGGPRPVTQQQGDFIQSFDVDNDIILIEPSSFTIAGQSVSYGDVFSAANANGSGTADLGEVGAAQVGGDTVIYLENGVLGSGYNKGFDVALATLMAVTATTVDQSNVQFG